MSQRELRAREIQESIRQVLLHDWDPIGVQHEPMAQDEYDSYVGGVYRLLSAGTSAQKLAKHLAYIQTRSMGLRAKPQSLMHVAEKLMGIDVSLHSPEEDHSGSDK